MATETIDVNGTHAVSERTAEIDPDIGPVVTRPAYILVIPRAQKYFWSYQWRYGERETLSAYSRGEGIDFATGHDAAAWLLGDDDSDAG